MLKCSKCSYETTRRFDLRRHLNRKTSCTRVNTNTDSSNSASKTSRNVKEISQNVKKNAKNSQNVKENSQNVKETMYRCDKCDKRLKNKYSYRNHLAICNGVRRNVCPVCCRQFNTRQAKHYHVRNIVCKPATPEAPSPPEEPPSVVYNTTNNVTTNIDNSRNVTININFGEEILERLCKEPDYLNRMENAVRLGKYALPQHISDIFFNTSFPMNNTIVKTRHNDRFVKIKTGEDQWDLRAMDDVYKVITEKMESYMTPYFLHVEKQMEKIYDSDRNKFKRLTRSIREFGHKVLWLDWKCDDIRQIGVELNEPYCEHERHRRIQEMKNLLLEHLYDKTRECLSFAT